MPELVFKGKEFVYNWCAMMYPRLRLLHQLLSDATDAANSAIKVICSLESGAGDGQFLWLVTKSTPTLQA